MDGGVPGADRATKGDASTDEKSSRGLLCASCGHRITEDRMRISMSGEHRHTFVNPHGIVFEIGVFAEAPGANIVGEPDAFFSWFPGYAWRIAACGGCRVHIGWSFGEAPDFFGIVLNRLA